MKKIFAAVLAIVMIGLFIVKGGITVQGQEIPGSKDAGGYLYSTYTVHSGDTVWDIAKMYYDKSDDDIRTYVSNLMKLNHIADARTLQVGTCVSVYYLDKG